MRDLFCSITIEESYTRGSSRNISAVLVHDFDCGVDLDPERILDNDRGQVDPCEGAEDSWWGATPAIRRQGAQIATPIRSIP
jgi:hypothetical protein